MKYLSNYTEKPISDLLEKNGAFFAFSDDQFNRAKDPELTESDYVSLNSGLICPKKNAGAVTSGLEAIYKNAIRQDIEENGIENIIKRELNNCEAYYTGEIDDTVDALRAYGITEQQVLEVYQAA